MTDYTNSPALEERKDWLCPTSDLSPFEIDPRTGGRADLSPEKIVDHVASLDGESDARTVQHTSSSIAPGSLIWLYAGGRKVVYGMGRAESTEPVGPRKTRLNVRWDSAVIRALVAKPIPWNSIEQAHPRKPTIAADATVRELLYWLGGISDDELGVPSAEADARLWVLARQVRRQGQPAFRAELIEHYGRRCAVGYDVEEALEAAHIAPYRGSDSNKTRNGLLLRADIHALFDAHLIGIAKDGTVVWSPLIDGTAYAEELKNCKLQTCGAGADCPDPATLQKHLAALRR